MTEYERILQQFREALAQMGGARMGAAISPIQTDEPLCGLGDDDAIGERPTDQDSVMKLALDAGNELPIWEHGLRGVK